MIARRRWQAVILGTGDPALEAAASQLARQYPQRVHAAVRFDSALSHRIYAGADMILIPSRYEPCGLTQMIGMRYGCVPVARSTGGLSDTIQDPARAIDSTGFLFQKASPAALAGALRRALDAWSQPDAWRGLQRRGMQRDFSWNRFARQYLALYHSLATRRQDFSSEEREVREDERRSVQI
jgi:starch synthase